MLKIYRCLYLLIFVLMLLCGISTLKAQTFPYKNSFKTNDANGITIGGIAYLTSSSTVPTPADYDISGDGVLRLTSAVDKQQGFVYVHQSFPSGKGIKVEFEYFTYGGTQADGISFFLFDASVNFEPGKYGGALGYAQNADNVGGQGMLGGFLSIGMDEYGNYGVATETKNGGFVQSNGFPYTAGTDNILTNGLVVIRGGVGPSGERFGPTAYPFLGGKITKTKPDGVTTLDDRTPRTDQILPLADQFNIAVNSRVTHEDLPGYRKVRLNITKNAGVNSGFTITTDIFVGEQQRWIKVLENLPYTIDDSRIPAELKAGFASSTGFRNAVHEIRNVTVTPSVNALLKPEAINDSANGIINSPVTINNILSNDVVGVNNATSIGVQSALTGSFVPGTIDLNPATIALDNVWTIPGQGEFTVNENGRVIFTPVTDFVGKATVNYTFQDNYVMTSTEGTISVTYNPLVADITKATVSKNTVVVFSASDFSEKFTGPALNKVRITSLPDVTKGTLQLNNAGVTSAIVLNQEISISDLGKIEFKPVAAYAGDASFGWNGSDGTLYALTAAKVNLSFVNAKPVLANTTETVFQNIVLSAFANTTFSGQFTDPDADGLVKIKITQLPIHGKLKGNAGAGVVDLQAGDEILIANLASLSYLPNLNNTNTDSFKWNGYDGLEYAVTDAVVTLVTGNSAPVVTPISKTGLEDQVLKFTASDFNTRFNDANTDELVKIILTSLPSDGTLRLNNGGVFTPVAINQEIPAADLAKLEFLPNPNFNGTPSVFNWNGSDGASYAAASAAITINISPVNDAPSFIKGADQSINNNAGAITVAGWATAISAGPVNESAQLLSFILSNTNNTLFSVQPAVAANGTLTFTPATNAIGKATITISIKDNGGVANGGADQSAGQTFDITIKPIGVNDTGITTINTPAGIPVTLNDGAGAFGNGMVITPSLSVKGGSTSVDSDGKVVYTPPSNYVGIDSYTYVLSKGGAVSDPITVNFKVKPAGTADAETIPVNTSIITNVKANDGPAAPVVSVVLADMPLHGAATVTDGTVGTIKYMPNADYQGSDSYTYILRTADGVDSDPVTVRITIIGTSISITKVATSTGPYIPGKTITYAIEVKNTGSFPINGLILSDANAIIPLGAELIGTLAPNAAKIVAVSRVLTQADIDAGKLSNQASVNGLDPSGAPVFKLSDDPGTVVLNDATVLLIPQNPDLSVSKKITSTGLYLLGSIITYDIVIKNTGNVTLKNLKLTDANALIPTGKELIGTLAPDASLTISVSHAVTQAELDAGKVINQASVNGTDPANNPVIKISDNPDTPLPNDATEVIIAKGPTANPDISTTKQGKPVSINILQNDLPGSTPIALAGIQIISPPTHGTIVINQDGTVTYAPSTGFKGSDEFTYTVKDENGLISNPVQATIAVQATNPEALSDEAEIKYNTSISIPVLNNDKIDDASLNVSTVEVVAQPQSGIVTVNPDGSIFYNPKKDFTGTDSFTYRVADVNGNFTGAATVNITVTGFMIPNVFTPNGDGKNDVFSIVGSQSYDNVELTVFNRWGNEVYRSVDYKNNWNGEGLNAGTYYYLIHFKNGMDKEVHKGWVLIKK